MACCELTARHGNGMGAAWARHAMCESAFKVLSTLGGSNAGELTKAIKRNVPVSTKLSITA